MVYNDFLGARLENPKLSEVRCMDLVKDHNFLDLMDISFRFVHFQATSKSAAQ